MLPTNTDVTIAVKPKSAGGVEAVVAFVTQGATDAGVNVLAREDHDSIRRLLKAGVIQGKAKEIAFDLVEAAKGKQSGRTQEIQRLIGRSLRAVVDLHRLGERQVIVDCDVIQADGGTRTASISGAWVALRIAVDKLLKAKAIASDPIRSQVAAVSCGIHQGNAVLDLDYEEDSQAGCDGNFVLTADGNIVEAQVTAEGECYDEEGLLRLLRLARIGCDEIFAGQLQAVAR